MKVVRKGLLYYYDLADYSSGYEYLAMFGVSEATIFLAI